MTPEDRTRQLIWKLLESKGESQQEFADSIGVQRSLVSQWKTGRSNSFTNSKYISTIADHFGVTADYLLGTNPSSRESRGSNELNEYLSELKNRSEMRQLFKVAKNASKQDVEQAVRIIEALKNPHNDDEP